MKTLQWGTQFKTAVMLLVVWWLGWMTHSFQSPSASAPNTHKGHKHKAATKAVPWTCSMHPQIKLPKKGKCPICFMDLIPLKPDANSGKPRRLTLTPTAKALANIQTTRIERKPAFVRVRMTGRVMIDETRLKTITAWVGGRLERLYVNYTGVRVKRGRSLVKIYSPNLVAAQQELFQALREVQRLRRLSPRSLTRRVAQQALKAARNKLKLLGLKSWQLQRLEKKRKPQLRTIVYAPIGGVVVSKQAREGMYVKTGTPIYTIADLSRLWVRFDAYERDLPWIKIGQKITFSTVAAPGQRFSGKVVFVDPVLDPKTRTVGVRINVNNRRGLLKPSMFVNGILEAVVDGHGHALSPRRKRRWKKGRKHKSDKHRHQAQDPLLIPDSAPLLTGKRAVVYVKVPGQKAPTWEGREIVLGPRVGRSYVVLKGLRAGDEVVTHGAFKLDSELQIRAKPSMMSTKLPQTRKQPPKLQKLRLSRRVLKRLTPVYKRYYDLQMALSSDSAAKSFLAYKALFKEVRRLRRLRGSSSLIWARTRARLYPWLRKVRTTTPIKSQRIWFQPISQQMIALMKQLGHAHKQKAFLAYCPMAFGNKGAYWLQTNKKLYNPYFGSQMLHCGEFKGSFPLRKPKKR